MIVFGARHDCGVSCRDGEFHVLRIDGYLQHVPQYVIDDWPAWAPIRDALHDEVQKVIDAGKAP